MILFQELWLCRVESTWIIAMTSDLDMKNKYRYEQIQSRNCKLPIFSLRPKKSHQNSLTCYKMEEFSWTIIYSQIIMINYYTHYIIVIKCQRFVFQSHFSIPEIQKCKILSTSITHWFLQFTLPRYVF